MATLSVSSTSSQTAEAILNRARRLSSNAYERVRPPTSFSEGEDQRAHLNAQGLLDPLAHRRSTQQRSSISRASMSNIARPKESLANINTASLPLETSSTTTTTTTTEQSSLVKITSDEPKANGADTTSSICHTSELVQTGLDLSLPHLGGGAITRPRALTLEAITETGLSPPVSPAQGSSSAKENVHRKHRSEEGGDHVRGILVAFRKQIELDSPTAEIHLGAVIHTTNVNSIIGSPPSNRIVVSAPDSELTLMTDTETALVAAQKEASWVLPSPQTPETPETPETPSAVVIRNDSELMQKDGLQEKQEREQQHASISLDNDIPQGEDADDDSDSASFDEPAEPLSSDAPERAAPILPTSTHASSSTSEKYHDAKATFLTKMGRRKNSISDVQDYSDSSSIKSNTTQHSSTSSKLSKKRSSKLFGKLVPKFLHTSFSPTISSSSTSPRSQTASLSPHSTRSSHSGSLGGGSPGGKSTSSSSALQSDSQESLARRSGNDFEQSSPGADEPSYPEYLESLRADGASAASILSGRRSSCSSNTSRCSIRSDKSRAIDAGVETKTDRFKFEVECDSEENDQDERYKASATTFEGCLKMGNDGSLSAGFNSSMDPPPSPYIIDENCGDDFFLNSVLRKKSQQSLPSPFYANSNLTSEAIMSCSYPSNTTISTVHSTSASSQASTPSPTSPSLAHDQGVYPFPASGTTKTSQQQQQQYQYRTNPLPTPINEHVDEKRTRLRDAVGEWRRTANMSCEGLHQN
ncbi:hypothetical protein BG004_000340 [Podila humilis]|nr:hypothetical protein BG004_000340 [Podila humilis]